MSKPHLSIAKAAFVFVCATTLIKGQAAHAVDYTTVVRTGDSILDSADLFYHTLDNALITDAGTISFVASVNRGGDSFTDFAGIFGGSHQAPQSLIQTSTTIAYEDIDPFIDSIVSNRYSMNDQGVIAGAAILFGAFPNEGLFTTPFRDAIYSNRSGGLAVQALTYNDVPGLDDGSRFFDVFLAPDAKRHSYVLNNNGDSAFTAELLDGAGFEAGHAIFFQKNGSLNLAAREGGPVPNYDATFFFNQLSDFTLDDQGVVTYIGRFENLDESAFGNGIFSNRSGEFAVELKSGDRAPDESGPYIYRDFSYLDTNASGDLAFVSSLVFAGSNTFFGNGVFARRNGVVQAIAIEGQAAAPGFVFNSQFEDTTINKNGDVVFTTVIRNPAEGFFRDALYSDVDGTLKLIALQLELAPGAGPDSRFLEFLTPSMNGQGQIVFAASFDLSSRPDAIYATDLDGDLQLIAMVGGLFDVDDDPLAQDLRTIERLALYGESGGEDGRVSPINDLGHVIFQLEFDDGTEGIFVASLNGVPVPEPSSMLLLGAGAALAIGRRRSDSSFNARSSRSQAAQALMA